MGETRSRTPSGVEEVDIDTSSRVLVVAPRPFSGDRETPIAVGHVLEAEEITIRDLVSLIQELSGFHGDIEWDAFRPDGQPQRHLDTGRAAREFGFTARTPLREGLAKTIRWYESVVAGRTVKAGK